MKKLLIGIIACLSCALTISLLFNFGILELPEGITLEDTEKTLEMSNIEIIMYDETYGSNGEYNFSETSTTVSVAFDVKNISKNPERLFLKNIALFDYNKNQYAPSDDYYRINNYIDRYTRLTSSEEINPNMTKKLYITFVVPRNDLYDIGITENIQTVGKQEFINVSRNIKCSYKSRKEVRECREKLKR